MLVGYVIELHTSLDSFVPQWTLVGVYDNMELAIEEVTATKQQMLLDDLPVGSIIIGKVLPVEVNSTINHELMSLKN